jgi:hypothetical protein
MATGFPRSALADHSAPGPLPAALCDDLPVMVLLWVVAVYLLAGLPDLLDDEEVGFGLDDPLDPLLFMPG